MLLIIAIASLSLIIDIIRNKYHANLFSKISSVDLKHTENYETLIESLWSILQ